jgi:hypothetical protein
MDYYQYRYCHFNRLSIMKRLMFGILEGSNQKRVSFFWKGALLLVSVFYSPFSAYATDYSADQFVKNPSTFTLFQDLLGGVITYLNMIVDPLVIIVFLWGAFQILTAGGDEAKIKSGKKTITYAAIGAAIIICASGLIYVINQLLGVQTP